MASLLIVAHTPLASSLLTLGRHTYAEHAGQIGAVDIASGSSLIEAEAAIRAAMRELPGGDCLLMVDVFGATPSNAAAAVADGRRVRVVSGVNVPMLWRTLCYVDRPLDELVDRALIGATQGVMHVGATRRQNQNQPPSSHDQDPCHHQQ